MEKLLTIVGQVIKAFDNAGIKFTSQDNCEDELVYEGIDGHTIVVGDDHNRRCWAVDLRITSCPEGASVCDVINGALGQGKNSGRAGTNNWAPAKKIDVVGSSDSVEFYQYYTKR